MYGFTQSACAQANESDFSEKDIALWASRQKFLYTSLLAMSIDFNKDANSIFESSSKQTIGGKVLELLRPIAKYSDCITNTSCCFTVVLEEV